MRKDILSCPRCGLEQEAADECVRCGVVFRKLRERENTGERALEDSSPSEPRKPSGRSKNLFRTIRISLLVFLLLMVSMSAWLSKVRTTSWKEPLQVVIWPGNGDDSLPSEEYISTLHINTFAPIEEFMVREAGYHGISLRTPIEIEVASEISELPPDPPEDGGILSTIWWSLRLRYWFLKIDPQFLGPAQHIKLCVLYYNPETHQQLAHSLGLQKGLIGVVHAFASPEMEERNNVVIAHEFFHTVGATDKYDYTTEQPTYPDGYAEPDKEPLFPQEIAEIMGGRIPLSETTSAMPEGLEDAVVGELTAREIKWIP